MKTIALDAIKDKHLGKVGTKIRDEYEADLENCMQLFKDKYPAPPLKVDPKKVIKTEPLMIKEDFSNIEVDPNKVMKLQEGTEDIKWWKRLIMNVKENIV
jgi:hypothetical protein